MAVATKTIIMEEAIDTITMEAAMVITIMEEAIDKITMEAAIVITIMEEAIVKITMEEAMVITIMEVPTDLKLTLHPGDSIMVLPTTHTITPLDIMETIMVGLIIQETHILAHHI